MRVLRLGCARLLAAALVIGALLWLSERRSSRDITDMRYRNRWRRN